MDEFSLIETIQPKYYRQSSLLKGIGDDAAVFRSLNEDIVTAVDTFVEGIHFTKKTMNPFHVGYRGLAANLSDMAAMGAKPAYYLVSIVVPKSWSAMEVQHVFFGMKELAKKYQMDLIGGDTVSGNELVLSITVIGFVSKNRARYRHTARVGDVVFVTGTLGDSSAGYYLLTKNQEVDNSVYFIKRHQLPSPRVLFSLAIQDVNCVTLNDVSDGIANEATEIAEASEVSIEIFDDQVPVSTGFQQFPKELQEKWKYFGGEDFELLGTVSPSNWETIIKIAHQNNLKVTKIGNVTKKQQEPVYMIKYGKKEKLCKLGYTHLK